jgi:phosphomannomutase
MITHIQITTSHNPAEDNGIKIIGPDGLSMKTQFEPYIEEFSDTESLEKSCEKLKKSFVTLMTGKKLIGPSQVMSLLAVILELVVSPS